MSIVKRFRGTDEAHRWHDVAVEPYAPGDPRAGTRQVLIGPADAAPTFALRYFELAPGTESSLDTHAHEHGVYILHGLGRVKLGESEYEIGPGDVVYVSPGDLHSFHAADDVSLGFLCIVPARR